jgi:putative DNA primase/helicase
LTPKEVSNIALGKARITPENLAVDLVLTRAADIEVEPIKWLWPGWIAAGKLHIIAGRAGTGKTTVALAVAATMTRGGKWPDKTWCSQPGNVVMWAGEDDAADTLVPRLAAMGADLSRIHFVGDIKGTDGKRPFDPARDVPGFGCQSARRRERAPAHYRSGGYRSGR